MKTKQDYIDSILNSKIFKDALSNISDETEKEHAIAYATSLGEQIANCFIPTIEKVQNDPDFADELRKHLKKNST